MDVKPLKSRSGRLYDTVQRGDLLQYYEGTFVNGEGKPLHYYRIHYIPDRSRPKERHSSGLTKILRKDLIIT
ncbi:MAG: hypothetical protein AOA65_0915 [Candidatus Bathyarchaeota archaeon BA1]|nr:MAG: hypothetical protein AOA65_0915 [Candidatus Bathyarchaeota archaeon BA1]